MTRTIDMKAEMRKIASSKPVHAAAGAGMLATQALRELPGKLAKWRSEGTVASLPARATGYAQSARAKAASEYDRLAAHGKRVMSRPSTAKSKAAISNKSK